VNRSDSDGKWDEEDWVILMKIGLGLASSQIMIISFVTVLLSGLLVLTSPFTWGLSLMFAAVVGYTGGKGIIDSIVEQRKPWPNFYTKENGNVGFKKGYALEIFGFLAGWYGFLEV